MKGLKLTVLSIFLFILIPSFVISSIEKTADILWCHYWFPCDWNDVWETSEEIPYWWSVTTQIWLVLLTDRAAWEICFNQSLVLPRHAVVTSHQNGISTVISQTSFWGETSHGPAKGCFLRLVVTYNQDIKAKPHYLYTFTTSCPTTPPTIAHTGLTCAVQWLLNSNKLPSCKFAM